MLTSYWRWGFSDVFALYSLGAGVGYVLKYVTKVNNALLMEKRNCNLVLSLALMWIFRKRAFSVSRDFGLFLVERKDDRPRGQVDLEGKSIYRWYLVGFWADLEGDIVLGVLIYHIENSGRYVHRKNLHSIKNYSQIEYALS